MDLSKLKDILPLGTFFILICSVTKLITYYKEFNIDIISYVTFPEIIFSFTTDIYNFLTIIIAYLMWWVFYDGLNIFWKKDLNNENPILLSKGQVFIRNLVFFILFGKLAGLLLGLIWGYSTGHLISLILTYVSLTYVIYKGPENHYFFKYLGLFIVFFFISRFSAESSADSVKNGRKKESVAIEFRNSDIKVDTNSIYVGRTSDYIFFYNRINQTSTIYNNADVIKFSIRK